MRDKALTGGHQPWRPVQVTSEGAKRNHPRDPTQVTDQRKRKLLVSIFEFGKYMWLPYAPITIAIPNGVEVYQANDEHENTATFEVELPTGLMRKCLLHIKEVKSVLESLSTSSDLQDFFEIGVGYDCLPGEVENDDAIWVPGRACLVYCPLIN